MSEDRDPITPSWPRWTGPVAGIIVIAGVLLRFVFPSSDPVHPTWASWITDEGRWTEMAREWALFQAPDLDTNVSMMHFLLGPLFQLLTGGVFEVFGVGLVAPA